MLPFYIVATIYQGNHASLYVAFLYQGNLDRKQMLWNMNWEIYIYLYSLFQVRWDRCVQHSQQTFIYLENIMYVAEPEVWILLASFHINQDALM